MNTTEPANPTSPRDIETRSFAIIESLLSAPLPEETAPIIKRVIHTTADFDYANSMAFTNGAVQAGLAAIRQGCRIVTDTQMALAGINKTTAAALGCSLSCHIADPDVAATAAQENTTRAQAAVDKAAAYGADAIFVVGNAPTALLRIASLIESGQLAPRLVVGVPVGFVNVVESKERILGMPVPAIIARGRKGGSNVAAAICNALLYIAAGR